ncbi:hypothetical protein DOTSEDRAFT_20800 [Dothistroma septosporum NZE10]|uniref:Uncharacterized protein n=1 Tax=Dothistroma septosporum (strain NZE10 / CBS 128990) TaxID=675120 RepID=N1PVL1_DOTSN|nr:hypothetical protein DOTSEDRAFT_20800 [Dothistroma septosporum NZE10]
MYAPQRLAIPRLDVRASNASYLEGHSPVNIQPPHNTAIGIVEVYVYVFLPAWRQIPKDLVRLMWKAVTQKMLTKLVINAVDKLHKQALKGCYEVITRNMAAAGRQCLQNGSWDITYAGAAREEHDMTLNVRSHPSHNA